MQIFELGSFPIDQVRDHDATAQTIGAWFADRPWPARLLAYSRRSNLEAVRRRVHAELGMRAREWARPW
ncbi:MAG TPA: hypothetical protein VFT99_02145, partial [Roseiflexaceae bacterium]|nr:hypothetical protein [Roseiflexaceae bacterium]